MSKIFKETLTFIINEAKNRIHKSLIDKNFNSDNLLKQKLNKKFYKSIIQIIYSLFLKCSTVNIGIYRNFCK